MTSIDEVLVEGLVRRLTDPSLAEPAARFPGNLNRLSSAGLYSWWADDEGRSTLGEPFGVVLPALIYAGQTGATSSKARVERTATLRSRIGGNHLNGIAGSSTFRKTLGVLLMGPLGLRIERPDRLDQVSNSAVSGWMRQHLAVATVPFDDRGVLIEVEHAILKRLDPPLNLMGMPTTPIRRQLRDLRRNLNR
jgi:hypothetical protein